MDAGDIAWTVGACVIGAIVGPIFQMVITPKPEARVVIGRDNNGVIDVGDHSIRVKVKVKNVFEVYSPQRLPRAERTSKTSSTGTGNDIWLTIGGIVVGSILLAILYANFQDVIIRVLIGVTAFSAMFLISSLIYLIARGVTFDAGLIVQLILLVAAVGAAGVSIYFLTSPPGFNIGGGTYADLVQAFRTNGTDGVNPFGINGAMFLVYEFIGALATALLSLVIILTSIKLVAITDLAVGANPSRFRIFLATAAGKPDVFIVLAVLLAAVAVAFSSGWLYMWISSNSTDLFPTTTPTTSPTPSVVISSTAVTEVTPTS